MKIEMDERLKHRLIGLAVIVSIIAIFAPAIIKKSSQGLDHNVTMNVKLPEKPLYPKLVMKTEKELFQKARVAHVELNTVPEESRLPQLAKAEMIHENSITKLPAKATEKADLKQKQAANTADAMMKPGPVQSKIIEKSRKSVPNIAHQKSGTTKGAYTVQLASFAKPSNAESLLKHLENKGYRAKIIKIKGKNSDFFQVRVGEAEDKNEAEKLKQQLASVFQLNGFVIHTGVS